MEEIKREIKICIETNENENTTQNLWNLVKAVLRGRFKAIQAYLKKQEKGQINNLTLYLKLGLKLNIQETKIMASGPITSWEIDGETVEIVADFIFFSSKITADGDWSHEI